MSTTVKELIKLPSFCDAELLAGYEGLSRPVSWVHIIDIPQFIPWIKEEDIVMTTSFPFYIAPEICKGLVEGLANKKVAALIIALGYYLNKAPEVIIEDANKYGFPVIGVPASVHFEELSREIIDSIFLNTYSHIKAPWRVSSNALIQSLLNKDLFEMNSFLSSYFRTHVSIFDHDGGLVIYNSALKSQKLNLDAHILSAGKELIEHFYKNLSVQDKFFNFSNQYFWWHLEPLYVSQEIKGFMFFCKEEPFRLDNLFIFAQVAILASKAFEVNVSSLRNGKDAKLDNLETIFPGLKTIPRNNKKCTPVFNKSFMVFVAQIDYYQRYITKKVFSDYQIREMLNSYYCQIFDHLFSSHNSLPILVNEDIVLGVIPASEYDYKFKEKLVRLQCALNNLYEEFEFSMGISSSGNQESELIVKAQEAIEVLCIGKIIDNDEFVYYYPDTFSSRLKAKIASETYISLANKEVLEALLKYDSLKETELLHTLKAYINIKGNINKVAKALFVHRNTVEYRLNNIQKLTGLDPRDPINMAIFSLLLTYDKANELELKKQNLWRRIFRK